MFFKRMEFMSWKEYSARIADYSYLMFLTRTCRESANNSWKKLALPFSGGDNFSPDFNIKVA